MLINPYLARLGRHSAKMSAKVEKINTKNPQPSDGARLQN
jgi:hypothetical protein